MGPWFSLGIHVDFKHWHFDIHFLWWIIVLGNTVEPIHCGYCDTEMSEYETICPGCGVDFATNLVPQQGQSSRPVDAGGQ